MTLLDHLFTCQHNSPTYADRLIASQADGLKAERENARLRRSVECLQDWFARASRRADAMEKAHGLLKGDNDRYGRPVFLKVECDNLKS